MRVAFDEQIFAIQPYGGISRMFAELAQQFIREDQLDVELLPLNAPVINRYALDHEDIRSRLAVWDARHEYRSLARYFMRFRPRRGQDIVHNTFYLPHGLARYPGAKRIVTIHDMIPEMMPQTRRRLDFLTLKKHYINRADHIICVSEATKRDLLSIHPDTQAPISVIHHGVHPRFTPHAPALPELPKKYVLFVGNRQGYKDADVLLEGFASIAPAHPDLHLIFVGGGRLTPEEKARNSRFHIAERVMQRDLSDEAMVGAYAHAQVFVFPSRFEGFGIPALEAMASGTPTVLANSTSLPEVGGDAAAYFTAGDAGELAERLREVLENESRAQELRAAGLTRVADFTWHRAAVTHAETYRATLTA